jgi:sulfite exporter TauE/SafE
LYDTLLTHLQILGIGFSFGMAGPCLLTCAPVLVTYILGREGRWTAAAGRILIFAAGRIAAYTALGALAGVSGSLIRRYADAGAVAAFVNPLAGAISILLGIAVLANKDRPLCDCGRAGNGTCQSAGLLALGFVTGARACAPLITLLTEIAMISKSAAEGALYAFSFGIGTAAATMVSVGAIAGVAGGLAGRFLRSASALRAFRIACAALLMILGAWIILQGARNGSGR